MKKIKVLKNETNQPLKKKKVGKDDTVSTIYLKFSEISATAPAPGGFFSFL